MKICMILTNGFDPDPRVYKEATSLVRLGHRVEIICWDREGSYVDRPIEILNNIKIVRFFANTQYGSGYKQIFKLISFYKYAYRYIKNGNFDAIHCHDFDGFYIGSKINKKLQLKLVYDEHDLFYTYFSNRKGVINSFICEFIKFKEEKLIKNADAHIVVTPEMKKLYDKKSNNISIITNAPSKDIFKDINKNYSDKLRIGYIGSVRYLDELKILAEVAQNYSDKVSVIISGRGIALDELKNYCSSFCNIEITGAFKVGELEELYKNIDITYAFYPSDVSSISMPNKFYESIISETPIIANIETEFGKLVEENKFGYALSEKDLYNQLNDIVKNIIDDPRLLHECIHNMKTVKDKYLWEANEEVLEEIYKRNFS